MGRKWPKNTFVLEKAATLRSNRNSAREGNAPSLSAQPLQTHSSASLSYTAPASHSYETRGQLSEVHGPCNQRFLKKTMAKSSKSLAFSPPSMQLELELAEGTEHAASVQAPPMDCTFRLLRNAMPSQVFCRTVRNIKMPEKEELPTRWEVISPCPGPSREGSGTPELSAVLIKLPPTLR